MAGTQVGRVALVAVHSWDINGAKAAGLMAAFVSAERPCSPVMQRPDVAAPTLAEAARALVALRGRDGCRMRLVGNCRVRRSGGL